MERTEVAGQVAEVAAHLRSKAKWHFSVNMFTKVSGSSLAITCWALSSLKMGDILESPFFHKMFTTIHPSWSQQSTDGQVSLLPSGPQVLSQMWGLDLWPQITKSCAGALKTMVNFFINARWLLRYGKQSMFFGVLCRPLRRTSSGYWSLRTRFWWACF